MVKSQRAINKRELARGIGIERREHHLPMKWTRKLVVDHLTENPRYYKVKR